MGAPPINQLRPEFINQAAIDEYRRLRTRALTWVRAHGKRTAETYEKLFTDGLYPLTDFIEQTTGQKLNDALERAWAAAAGVRQHPTINDMLENAGARFLYRPAHVKPSHDFMATKMESAGACVEKVLGCLIKPDSAQGGIKPSQDGNGTVEITFAPKAQQLLAALTSAGIYSNDIRMITGTLLPTQMRARSYTLIEIPKMNAQIAVCDQVGEITFASNRIRPLDDWLIHTKDELRALDGIIDARYDHDGKWINAVLIHICEGKPAPQDAPRVTLPRASAKPLLSESILVRMLYATQKKTGKWATQHDKDVYDFGPDGEIIHLPDENWTALHQNCRAKPGKGRGLGGLGSLAAFKEKHKLGFYTEDDLLRMLRATHQKTGKWAIREDEDVYDFGPNGEIILLPDEKWWAFDHNCGAKPGQGRGLGGNKSLAEFKEKHGLSDEKNYTPDDLLRMLYATRQKTGKWATAGDKDVYDFGPNGEIIHLPDETWTALHQNCGAKQGKGRGLGGLGSLAEFKEKHKLGFYTEDDLLRMLRATRQKTGKWAAHADKDVYDFGPDGEIILLLDETWTALNWNCKGKADKGRGLGGNKSLAEFKKKHAAELAAFDEFLNTFIGPSRPAATTATAPAP